MYLIKGLANLKSVIPKREGEMKTPYRPKRSCMVGMKGKHLVLKSITMTGRRGARALKPSASFRPSNGAQSLTDGGSGGGNQGNE